jgi:hypothetical protein
MLDDPAKLPPLPRRSVVWHEHEGADATGLRVVPVPLVAALDVLLRGGTFVDAAARCEELAEVMTTLAGSLVA